MCVKGGAHCVSRVTERAVMKQGRSEDGCGGSGPVLPGYSSGLKEVVLGPKGLCREGTGRTGKRGKTVGPVGEV